MAKWFQNNISTSLYHAELVEGERPEAGDVEALSLDEVDDGPVVVRLRGPGLVAECVPPLMKLFFNRNY